MSEPCPVTAGYDVWRTWTPCQDSRDLPEPSEDELYQYALERARSSVADCDLEGLRRLVESFDDGSLAAQWGEERVESDREYRAAQAEDARGEL